MRVVLACCILLVGSLARAYPSFIGYGYTSCLNCHFNAYGGGPLTDYGRAVSATAVSARPFWNSNASDEELGDQSGFLGSVELPRWIRADAHYRGLLLASQLQSDAQMRYITMKADASLVIKPTEKIWAVGNLGYIPQPSSQPNGKQGYISREHYVAVQPIRPLRIYAGLTDVIYGIRVPDHNAFSRQVTLLAQNDQTHGMFVNWTAKKYDLGVQGFVGNLFEKRETRLVGGASTFECEVAEKFRLGTSAYYGRNDFRSRMMAAIHGRVGAGEGSSLLAEFGFIRQSVAATSTSTLGSYLFLQSAARLVRGLFFLTTGEYYTADTFVPRSRLLRVSPGLQYFPMQRLELRLDVSGTRTVGGSTVDADRIDVMSQVHVWF